jgi:3-isopropylmalate/(R)-2-methylmalate dehydratase large subunit
LKVTPQVVTIGISMPSPTTLTQKLIARASARDAVAVGERVDARFDLALLDDAAVVRHLLPLFAEQPRRLADPSRVVVALDRFGAEHDGASREKAERVRHWTATQGIERVLEGRGIGHVVAPQAGWIRPGMLCIGSDLRMPTAGAFGAYALATDAVTLVDALATGRLSLEVPGTLFMRWTGRLPLGVSAKDMVLDMIERYGADAARDRTIEFCGEAVAALSMAERMTLTNMSCNLGAATGLVAPDATTRGWLEAVGADIEELGLQRWESDEDAPGVRHHLDASTLAPQVALPAESAQVRAVTDLESTRVDIAYLGACTGAKLDDLRAAARVLAGYRVAPGVRLLVAPASAQDRFAAEREGILRRLVEAGATLLPASCGACAGLGGHIPEGAQVVSSAACNRAGRMGAATAQIFLASPYTVAASALRGRLSDAREVLS